MEIADSISELCNHYKNDLKEYESQNKNEALDFNVFNFINDIFYISEPKHSRIIAFLLNPRETHGQKELFLHLLLEELGIHNYKENKWTVNAEKDHVDILITSPYPVRKTIIIENKSNWAIDQENQLYRYWHQQIYEKNNRDLGLSTNTGNNRIIYLSPDTSKSYPPNSISRPSYYEDTGEPASLDENLIDTWLFHVELKNWLEKCAYQESCPPKIKSLINDYIAFWEATNNKQKFVMENLTEYFSDKKDTWLTLLEIAEKQDDLKKRWLGSLANNLEKLPYQKWKFDYDRALTCDMRWFVGEWDSSLSFVYEQQGISIWKKGFASSKRKYKDEFIKLFGEDFSFVEDDTDNYVMTCRNTESLIFSDLEKNEFIWIVGNQPESIVKAIDTILSKYLRGNDEVLRLFKKIDEETKVS